MPSVPVLSVSREASRGVAARTGPGPLRRGIPSALGPVLLAPVVLLIHGYHPFAGDAGIYVAGVRHILDPALYPLNADFPVAFTRLSLFPWALAGLVRLTHEPLSWVLLAAHLASIFLFLLACRQLAARLFASEGPRWCAVLLAAGCFTLPVAGTALFVMDPYVTARSFSTPLTLFSVVAAVDRAWLRAAILLALAALIHPLMAVYALVFVVLQALVASGRFRTALGFCCVLVATAGAVFFPGYRSPVSPDYREAVSLPARTFLFLARWHGYEVLGLVLPLALFGLAIRRFRLIDAKRALCLTCLLLGITSTAIAMFFAPTGGPYVLVPLQVLRSFHLIYVVGVVLCGGVLGALLSRSRVAGISVVVLLFAGMFVAHDAAWPGCARIEWPGTEPSNPWQTAFLWIRDNTPKSAVFAFDPELVYRPLEDEQGFRAIAERDHLADDKDAGIVAVQPQLADRWARQRNAELDVDRTTDAQRVAALKPLGATWLLLPPKAETTFLCPYKNTVAKACSMKQ